jgi:hypothetical protein
MPELVLNVHMHTTYSDGNATHSQIARSALKAGLDAIIVTDHNIFVNGLDGYHQENGRRVLLLVGEEVHDPLRQPQKNHTLVFGAGREVSTYGADPQQLINQVNQSDGLTFLAHPFENALPLFGETDITWVNWEVKGFTGLELWNGLSELKDVVHSYLGAIFYVFFPQYIARGPQPATLKKWDELNSQGKRFVAIGGADAHNLDARLGPLHRRLFPYEFHFRCINNHLLTPEPLTGNLLSDRKMIINALRQGHSYIGYDLPASTRGFSFTAKGRDTTASMGDEIELKNGVTLQIHLPLPVECRLIKDGTVIKSWNEREILTYLVNQPGVYRVECFVEYLGRRRAWIFSNPIYIRG